MAISNELSGEIAAALLTVKDRSPRELNDLKKIIFDIHSTLQRLARGYGKTPLANKAQESTPRAISASRSGLNQ